MRSKLHNIIWFMRYTGGHKLVYKCCQFRMLVYVLLVFLAYNSSLILKLFQLSSNSTNKNITHNLTKIFDVES